MATYTLLGRAQRSGLYPRDGGFSEPFLQPRNATSVRIWCDGNNHTDEAEWISVELQFTEVVTNPTEEDWHDFAGFTQAVGGVSRRTGLPVEPGFTINLDPAERNERLYRARIEVFGTVRFALMAEVF